MAFALLYKVQVVFVFLVCNITQFARLRCEELAVMDMVSVATRWSKCQPGGRD